MGGVAGQCVCVYGWVVLQLCVCMGGLCTVLQTRGINRHTYTVSQLKILETANSKINTHEWVVLEQL